MVVGAFELQHAHDRDELLLLATRQACCLAARARQATRDPIGVVAIERARQQFGGDLERLPAQRDLERLEVVGWPVAQELFDFLLDLCRERGAEPFFSSAWLEATLTSSI